MDDMEHKINPRAQRAALRRLSERANAFPDRIPHPAALVSASNSSSSSTSTSSSSTASSFATDSLTLPQFASQLADHLRSCAVPLSRGLSQIEFERIEAIHGFVFPPDLRALLSHSLPTAPGFPDWRSPSSPALTHLLNIPVATISSLVRSGGFWCSKHWGARPGDHSVTRGGPQDAAVQTARHRLRMAPVLIPVFGFFFIPASPNRAGNPLFLVQDGAVVCCGGGLGELFKRGFLNGICDELQFDQAQESEENRRWSTSTVVERLQSDVERGARTRSLPVSGRRDSVIIEDENEPSEYESWGRSLDALARCSLEALKRRRRQGSISGRRRSSFSGMEIQEPCTLASNLTKSVMNNLLTFSKMINRSNHKLRRIEFWSDAAEKLLKDHHKRMISSEDDPFRFSMCLSPGSVSRPRTGCSANEDTEIISPMNPSPIPGQPTSDSSQALDLDSSSKDDGSPWISSLLKEVATRLRNAGWREDEISEMVDGASPKSVLFPTSNNNSDDPDDFDVQQLIKSKMANVPYFFGLSMSLKKAGFSSQEVSDVLCFDPIKRSDPSSRVPPTG